MLILVINCGSSSIKYKLFEMKKDELLCEGIVERIGERGTVHRHNWDHNKSFQRRVKASDHHTAMALILNVLTEKGCAVLENIDDIDAVGHRVVHGGERYSGSVMINREVLKSIQHFCNLAPLHNPPALFGIKSAMKYLPKRPHIAVFDTAFHQTIPRYAYLYAIPERYYRKYSIRRYGFHGTSHKYVAQKAARMANRPLTKLKIITCHLGNGCSMSAVYRGKSIDTTMGFTPLEGLVMGTRCGDIDPAIITYLQMKEHLTPQQVEDILNKKSGLLGVSGLSNNMRELKDAERTGDPKAHLAIELFYYRIKKYIGAYIGIMDGVDLIVLTAGIGENHLWIKERLKRDLSGIIKRFDARILVIPTKEEWMIASETFELLKKHRRRYGKSKT